jgi:hypothetical protein
MAAHIARNHNGQAVQHGAEGKHCARHSPHRRQPQESDCRLSRLEKNAYDRIAAFSETDFQENEEIENTKGWQAGSLPHVRSNHFFSSLRWVAVKRCSPAPQSAVARPESFAVCGPPRPPPHAD